MDELPDGFKMTELGPLPEGVRGFMSKERILDKVLSGTNDKNIRFQDLRKLLSQYGFSEPYQVKQVRNISLKYRFYLGEV